MFQVWSKNEEQPRKMIKALISNTFWQAALGTPKNQKIVIKPTCFLENILRMYLFHFVSIMHFAFLIGK
jgi:hypothetical protein